MWLRSVQSAIIAALIAAPCGSRAADPELEPWKAAVVRPATSITDRHVIHSYFNVSPESPNGEYVLFYTSETPEGESGDIRIVERATGKETVLASDVVTEDAHRAACQQWSNGGKTVLYHNYQGGRWKVLAVDVASLATRVLAEDHQLGFGSATGSWAPVYGCHWNPGPHRDLKLVHVDSGEIRVPVTAEQVVSEYGEWIQGKFGTTEVSIFFPVMSPDGSHVFFKLSRPSGGSDFRSKRASAREGKVIFDLQNGRFVRLVDQWGHPSWTPDSKGIFEKGNFVMDISSGSLRPRYAPSCISDHPTVSPNGRVFVTDADVTKRPFGKPGYWGIAIGSTKEDSFAIVDMFDNTKGATSWRHNHPHPAFSADSNRVYYNVNDGPWTRLMVAEAAR